MIEINKLNARIYSKLGQSGATFGLGLFDVLDTNTNLVVLSSDMSRAAGLDRFKAQYSDRFFNIGIAEQNLIGVAAGLSSEGKTVIVTAQAAFISMRSCEQMRQYLGYMHSNVVAIGLGAGFALTFFGNTHYAMEDVSILRSIPGMTIISPADAGQAAKALVAAVNLKAPVYIRLTSTLNCPIVYNEDYNFIIGKSIQLKHGDDITIYATGSMVYYSLKAAELIEQEGISVRVVDMHTIKPIDVDRINNSQNSNLFVSVEEHSVIGGLGSAISEYISSKKGFPPLLRLGVMDTFSHPGDYLYLLEQNRLQPQLITEDILNKYKSINQ
jgi:transketolase